MNTNDKKFDKVNDKKEFNNKGKKPYRGKKPYDKGKNSDKTYSKDEFTKDREVGTNDPKWYLREKRLIDDAIKIGFANQLGSNVYLNNASGVILASSGLEDPFDDYIVPGLMVLKMINTIGVADNSMDGPNLAYKMTFQKIREDLSTYAPYAIADVGMTIEGIDDVYSMYSHILRLFGLVNDYSAVNFYYPKGFISTIYGFSDDEISKFIENINDYRSRFNNLIYSASRLYLPVDFSVVNRHSWLYSNIYTDGDSVKAQSYAYSLHAYHVWDDTSDPNGTRLVTKLTPTTMDGLLDAFEEMILAMWNSDSFQKIQADMKRAYKDASIWKLAYCDEGYAILPIKDEMVLNQIHNTNWFDSYDLESFDIQQSVNHNMIICTPGKTNIDVTVTSQVAPYVPLLCDKLINYYVESPSIELLADSTRNLLNLKAQSTEVENIFNFRMESSGVDVCVGIEICTMGANYPIPQVIYFSSNTQFSEEVLNFLSYIACFDWAPIIYLGSIDPDTEVFNLKPMADLCNYTRLDYDNLNLINRNIIMSMYSITAMSSPQDK